MSSSIYGIACILNCNQARRYVQHPEVERETVFQEGPDLTGTIAHKQTLFWEGLHEINPKTTLNAPKKHTKLKAITQTLIILRHYETKEISDTQQHEQW